MWCPRVGIGCQRVHVGWAFGGNGLVSDRATLDSSVLGGILDSYLVHLTTLRKLGAFGVGCGW